MHRKLLLLITVACISLSSTAQNNQALFSAVEKNDITAVKKLLEEGANPNAIDEYEDAILMQAAIYSSAECMKLLLDKGADANFKNKQGLTALSFCTHEPDKIKLLLSKGVELNVSGKSGNTPLMIAAVGNSNYEAVKLLLDHGADPMVKNRIKESALGRAAPPADNEVIDLLLAKGIQIDSASENFTPLSAAIAFCNREVVLHLLKKGANPNIRDAYGLPVGLAVVFPDTSVTHLLIEKTANINDLDVDGLTAIVWALYNEHDQPEVIQDLINHGADVNFVFKNGSTPLSWALQKGNTKSVEVLKKAGAKK